MFVGLRKAGRAFWEHVQNPAPLPPAKRIARAEVAVLVIGLLILVEVLAAAAGFTSAWLLAAGLTPMLWINIKVIRKARRDQRR